MFTFNIYKFQRLFFLVLLICPVFFLIRPIKGEDDILQPVITDFKEVNIKDAEQKCSDIIFDGQKDRKTKLKALIMCAIAITLLDEPEKVDKIQNLINSFSGDVLFKKTFAYLVCEYLGGKINRKHFIFRLKSRNTSDKAIGILCIYLSAVKQSMPYGNLSRLAKNYKKLLKGSLKWVRTWENRISVWDTYIKEKNEQLKFKKVDKQKDGIGRTADNNNNLNIEPLFKAYNPRKFKDSREQFVYDITKIRVKAFEKTRAVYKNRPRPRGLLFNKDKMRRYILSLKDKKQQKAELTRYNKIKNIREYIVHLFARNSYKGPIKLRYMTVFGTVYLANDEIFRVKRGHSRKGKSYKWTDLHFKQWINFMKHFARLREKLVVPGKTRTQIKHDAAEDYLRLAVLCDWYKYYRSSLKYARKALQLWPEKKDDVTKLFLGEFVEDNKKD